MGRIVKWFLIAIAGVVTLLIVLALAVIFLVNPNDYRGEIEHAVTAQTGRKLAIEGDLKLAFFPWIGLQADKVRLADAPGFGKAPFFQASHVQLAVKVLPLLQGNLVVNTITLEHPQIHLIRNEKGQGNWQTFGNPRQGPAGPEQPPPHQAKQLPPILQNASLAGLRIRDGLVTWDDQQTGQHAVITPLNTTVEDVRLGAPITIKADWKGQIKSGSNIAGNLTGTVTADQQLRQINARNLDLTLNVAGGKIPGGKQQLRIRAQAAADLGQATYRLTDLRLDAAGVQVTAQLAAQRVEGAMIATGQLEVPEFNPREVLQRLGKAVPDTRDPNVLKRVSAKTELRYRDGQFTLKPLTVHMDDSVLTGQAKLRSFTGPAVDFDLALDHLDVDRYRSSAPPKGKQTAATAPATTTPSASSTATGASQLSIKTLRTLDLNGHAHIDTLKASGATVSNADVTIRAKDGQLRVHPLTAALYGGTYQGDMRLDATGKTPRITLIEHLSGVQAGPLLTDTISFQKLLGTADLNLNAKTQGQALDDWLQGLTGLARFTFRNGAVKGIDIAQTIREALARIKGEPPPASTSSPQTDFTELGGTLNLDGGVVRNTDFSAKSPLLRVEGQGAANLLKQTVDYHLTVNIVGTLKGQGGKDLEQLRGLPIPLRFTGKLSEPKLSVDLAGLFKKRLEQKQQQLEEKAKEKLQKKLNQQLEHLFNR